MFKQRRDDLVALLSRRVGATASKMGDVLLLARHGASGASRVGNATDLLVHGLVIPEATTPTRATVP